MTVEMWKRCVLLHFLQEIEKVWNKYIWSIPDRNGKAAVKAFKTREEEFYFRACRMVLCPERALQMLKTHNKG